MALSATAVHPSAPNANKACSESTCQAGQGRCVHTPSLPGLCHCSLTVVRDKEQKGGGTETRKLAGEGSSLWGSRDAEPGTV